ncbi:MAG: serpin family protein [Balneolaceae bacterium]|nr:serpin family protein [Balneolaceae bacterium]
MKRTLSLFLILSSFFLFTGCDLTESDKTPDRELPRQLSVQELMVAEASNNFSFRLLHMLREKEEGRSFFVSPLSISTAFGMALNGSETETYEQMRDFFGFDGMTREEINNAYKDLIELLTTLDPQVVMNIANSVWIREGFPVKEPFLDNNRNYFDAEVRELDFGRPDAPDIINNWIEDKTEGLIEEMIDQIGPLVVLYLINAIYFNGDWTVQFDPDETKDAPFYLADDTATDVSMMQARQQFRYFEDDTWTALDMWYGDAGFSFTALIPTGNTPLDEVISDLSLSRFESITQNLQEDTLNVFVPKFELDYEIEQFPEELQQMGLTLPFDELKADFSGINEEEQLYISNVLHRAVIKLDEEGSEAAAVTVIEISRESSGGGSAYKTIRLDRPFLFFIRENNTNTILFMGAYSGIE